MSALFVSGLILISVVVWYGLRRLEKANGQPKREKPKITTRADRLAMAAEKINPHGVPIKPENLAVVTVEFDPFMFGLLKEALQTGESHRIIDSEGAIWTCMGCTSSFPLSAGIVDCPNCQKGGQEAKC